MVGIVFIDVYVKMEESVIHVMVIAFVCPVLPVVDVNLHVHQARLDTCVYKNVNVSETIFVIQEQVIKTITLEKRLLNIFRLKGNAIHYLVMVTQSVYSNNNNRKTL